MTLSSPSMAGTRGAAWPALVLPYMVVVYGLGMTDGFSHILGPVDHGLVFNSMLEHLLHGTFDVDPVSIGDEGFRRDGRTYAYFGIFLALLRLPLLLGDALATTDVTRLSCLAALCLGGAAKLRTALEVYRRCEATPRAATIAAALAFSIVLGGPQIQFLKPSLYQEPCLWAGAFAAVFVYCAVRGLVAERGFSGASLALMALLAGLALLTRVSIGLGLYLALAFLIIALAWPTRRFLSQRFVPALAILAVAAALCGLVNEARWGDPLVFADLRLNILYQTYSDRLPRLERYGAFNLARLGYGLLYYFAPIWVVIGKDGQFLFHDVQQRLVESAELPPSSFLLSDPLLIVLGLAFLWSLRDGRRRHAIDVAQAAALLAGLAVPGFLILTAVTMAFRYRIEFYPLLELSAFLGFYLVCREAPRVAAGGDRRFARIIWGSAATGIATSLTLLVLYRLSPFGPSTVVLDTGWIGFYLAQLAAAR